MKLIHFRLFRFEFCLSWQGETASEWFCFDESLSVVCGTASGFVYAIVKHEAN